MNKNDTIEIFKNKYLDELKNDNKELNKKFLYEELETYYNSCDKIFKKWNNKFDKYVKDNNIQLEDWIINEINKSCFNICDYVFEF